MKRWRTMRKRCQAHISLWPKTGLSSNHSARPSLKLLYMPAPQLPQLQATLPVNSNVQTPVLSPLWKLFLSLWWVVHSASSFSEPSLPWIGSVVVTSQIPEDSKILSRSLVSSFSFSLPLTLFPLFYFVTSVSKAEKGSPGRKQRQRNKSKWFKKSCLTM